MLAPWGFECLSSDSGTQALTLTSVSCSNLSRGLLKMFLQGVIGPKIGGTNVNVLLWQVLKSCLKLEAHNRHRGSFWGRLSHQVAREPGRLCAQS